MPASGVLVIIPCGQSKIWDKNPRVGPVAAGEAYTGGPFGINKAYAEKFASRWVILSAKYGFVSPDFMIPGPYNVTFKDKATHPVGFDVLSRQITDLGLAEAAQIVGLGGKEYRAAISTAFEPFGQSLVFPFAGLTIGRTMQAVKAAIRADKPF